MYKYYNNLLPCSISQLYAKNDSDSDIGVNVGAFLYVCQTCYVLYYYFVSIVFLCNNL